MKPQHLHEHLGLLSEHPGGVGTHIHQCSSFDPRPFKWKWVVRGDGCWSPTCQPASTNSNAKRLYCLSHNHRRRDDENSGRGAAAGIPPLLQLEPGLTYILGLTCVFFRLSVYRLRVHGPVLSRCSRSSPPVPGTGRQHWSAHWASADTRPLGAARQTADWPGRGSAKPT